MNLFGSRLHKCRKVKDQHKDLSGSIKLDLHPLQELVSLSCIDSQVFTVTHSFPLFLSAASNLVHKEEDDNLSLFSH